MDMGSRHISYNIVDKNKERLWRTADGQEIPFSKVTHQHWSNIYWYHLMIVEKYIDFKHIGATFFNDFAERINHAKVMSNVAKVEIDNRFSGIILDWIPIYENEKEWYKDWCTRTVLVEKFKC